MTPYAVFCGVMLFLLGVAGIIGNILIIGAVYLEKQLKNIGNVFIINLAIVDLLVTATAFPVLSTSWISGNILSVRGCVITGAISSVGIMISILSIAAIAFERYVKVCRTASYSKIYSRRTIGLHVFFIWTVVIVALSPAFLRGENSFVYESRLLFCIVDFYNFPALYILMVSALIMGCITMCCVCYLQILKAVRQSRRKVGAANHLAKTATYAQRDVSLLKSVFTVFATYLILSSPGSLAVPFDVLNFNVPVQLYHWSVYLIFINSVVNGFIYGITNRKFRNGYMKFVKILFCRMSVKGSANVLAGNNDRVDKVAT